MTASFLRTAVAVLLLAGMSGLQSQALGVATQEPSSPGIPRLFSDTEPPALEASGPATTRLAREVVRSRRAGVEVGLLLALQQPGDRLLLELFDDVSYTAVLNRIVDDPFNGYSWNGRLEGVELSSVTLVVHVGGIAGTVVFPEGHYRIRYAAPGLSIVDEIDPAAFPPEAEPLVAPSTGAIDPGPRLAPPRDRSVFDVLVFFTRAAMKEAGGKAALIAAIKTAIQDMNTAFDNAMIDARVRLLKIKKMKYEEAGRTRDDISQALREITVSGDGQMEKAQRLRERFGADLVALITAINDDLCGIGWKPGQGSGVSASDAKWGYSVTTQRCLTNQTLAHELGHNFGNKHAHEDSNSSGLGSYPYAFGYKAANLFRTIMALPGGVCPGNSCPRILSYSNPKKIVEGERVGVKARRKDGADIAKAINNDRGIIEGWRACKLDC